MGSVGQMNLACAIRVEMKHLERSYSNLCCSVPDILSFVTPPSCVHMHLWQGNPLCLPWGLWVKKSLHVQWGLKWSIWRVIQLYAVQCRILGPLSPHLLLSHAFVEMQSIRPVMGSVVQVKLQRAIKSKMKHLERSSSTLWIFGSLSAHRPAFTCIWGNAIPYACDGICWSSEACFCQKGLNEAFWKKLFNFMLLSSGYFVLCHPCPLRLQEIVAMPYLMLAMGSVGQMKLASAIGVWLKHFERSYSTLCCWIPGILSFLTPPLCVYKKL